jgi:hypothetical protein
MDPADILSPEPFVIETIEGSMGRQERDVSGSLLGSDAHSEIP